MRLMTFNIRFGAGSGRPDKPGYNVPSSKAKIGAVADAIASAAPDVVALQEVKGAAQAERIAGLLGMKYVYTRHPISYALDFFEWGLAVLFRSKLLQVENPSLETDRGGKSRRKALKVALDPGGGRAVFINVHLDHRGIRRQLEAIRELAAAEAPLPTLMGDFNCPPQAPELAVLGNRYVDTCTAASTASGREAEKTGTLVGKALRIDHIFIDPKCYRVENAGLVADPHRRVSDHVAYYADVEAAGDDGSR